MTDAPQLRSGWFSTGTRGITVLVCGGRNYSDTHAIATTLAAVHAERKIKLLIEGGAAGADFYARQWALGRHLETRSFYADWKKHGRAAGPIRNREMLSEGKPDLVVAFPGGRGTADMISAARAAGVEVLEVA